MTKLKFIIGIVFMILFIALTMIVSGNSVAIIIDIASLIITVGLAYVLISLIYSPGEQSKMVGEILSNDSSDQVILEKSLAYLKSLKNLIIMSGMLGTLLGTISILVHLEDPESIGPNFSVALITVLYALLYVLIIIEPLRASAEKKLKS